VKAFLRASVVAAGCAGVASADVVKTSDGKTYEGKVVERTDAVVVVETTFDGRKELPKAIVVAVDTSVPPLREQLAFRLDGAKDVASLVAAHDWAKAKGFKEDLDGIWRRVLAVDPQNVRAHKALGHLKVGARWMTKEEKEAAEREAFDAAQRAKGLVLHDGRWVTKEEKDALDRGLVKDGPDWVTEEVFHARRGERLVGGKWVRVGEEAGKARTAELGKAVGVPLAYVWGPRVDLHHELTPEDGKAVHDAAEAVATGFVRLLGVVPGDGLDDLRVEVVVTHKVPAYARYAQTFDKEQGISKKSGWEGWPTQVARMPSFWWTDPKVAIGTYLFPNPIQVAKSAVAHDVSHALFNRYRFNYRHEKEWLREGLAYHLEIAHAGPSFSFNIGRDGVPGGGDPVAWQDTTKWPELLKALVAAGQDPPLASFATATGLGRADLAKSWSLVTWLVENDRAKFKTFVDTAKKNRDEPLDEALRTAYGLDFRSLDAKWRESIAGPPPAPAPVPATPPGKKKP
jgi:hypothetical protein